MAAEDLRTRILDAAGAVVRELGPSPRLLSAIAERAGVSRPTLYKYVGDKFGVFDALFEQELVRVLDLVAQGVDALRGSEQEIVDLLVGLAESVRSHPMLADLIDNHPQLVLRQLPKVVPTVLSVGPERVGPAWDRALAERRLPSSLDLRAALTWATRSVLGVVLMPDEGEDLRESVTTAFDMVSAVHGRDPATRRPTA